MYIPTHFRFEEETEILEFMRRYSFAVITSSKEDVPVATHLPFTVEKEGDNVRLYGHFARANDQWKGIEEKRCLVIFSEPHAYISPSHYEKSLNVPTWNYLSVHVYGRPKIITNEAEAFALLKRMIHTFEAEYLQQWEGLPEDYKLKMLKGIVPFVFEVEEILAKKKLSQNKSDKERQNIIEAFEKSEDQNAVEIANLMKSRG